MHYVIKPHAGAEAVESIKAANMAARVDALANRAGVSVFTRKLRKSGDRVFISATGRVNVAGERRGGFIVERVG